MATAHGHPTFYKNRGHFGAFVDRGLGVVCTHTCMARCKCTWWVSDSDIIASLTMKVQA